VLRALDQHPERGVHRICFLGFRPGPTPASLKSGPFVQRLFATFPEGWPGTGLICLRAIAAIPLVQFITVQFTPAPALSVSLQFLSAACSVLLMIGLWTPIAGSLMAIAELSLLFFQFNSTSMHIVIATLGAALAMTGPGAWSIDARLFGRKRIRIP
jgi:putative oxidoreductase